MIPAISEQAPAIVLVDEDGRGITELANGLEQKGYTVQPWRWGNGLRGMLARERPALAIVDVDGRRHRSLWQMLRQVRQDPTTSDIPLVLCVGEGASVPLQASRHRIVQKPLDRRAVYTVIEEVVGAPPAPIAKRRAR